MTGWGFVHPGWLAALGALLLPVVLHLISRGTRRRVAIGSIALLQPHVSRRFRRLRPTRLWLLVVRCLLIAALALALAGLVRSDAGGGDPTWGLISAEVATAWQQGALDAESSSSLASLASAGRLRRLAPDLARWSEDDEPSVATELPAEDVWSYLRQAAAIAPAGTTLEVYAYDRIDHLVGRRPALAATIAWPPLIGPVEDPPTLDADARPRAVRLRFAEDRADDGAYLVAALGALEDGAARVTVDAQPIVADEEVPASVDALIWLADEAPPPSWEAAVGRGATLLVDRGPPWRPCDTGVTLDDPLAPRGRPTRIRRTRCVDLANAGVAVWRDDQGEAMLATTRLGRGARWTLAGRFHPAWSTLVRSSALPRGLARWLASTDLEVGQRFVDRRPAHGQRLPAKHETAPGGASPPASVATAGLAGTSPAWWLVVLLVLVERGMALGWPRGDDRG